MKHFILTAILLMAVIQPAFAQNEANVEIQRIKNNIHLIISPEGGNVIVSTGPDGTFIIDDQLENRHDIIEKVIKNITDKDVKFVLNTHYHFDHTGGNTAFGSRKAIILSHDNVRERLSTNQFITYFNREMHALSQYGLPTVTFNDEMTLHYNNNNIEIIHVPNAHTDGDVIAYFKEANVLVAGDLIFNNTYPFIDFEHGGSFEGLLEALDKLLEIADTNTVILPGHGGPISKHGLQTYQSILETIGQRVRLAVFEDKTLEEVIAAKPTAAFDKEMGGGIVPPDDFVTLLYNHFKAKKS